MTQYTYKRINDINKTINIYITFSIHIDEMSQNRRPRGGTVGLFAFPRVGRSDPDALYNWDGADLSPSVYLDEYDMPSHTDIKRPNIIPFPRVGRSEKYVKYAARNQEMKRSNGPNGGLWFGPRLGRLQKRSNMENTNQADQL